MQTKKVPRNFELQSREDKTLTGHISGTSRQNKGAIQRKERKQRETEGSRAPVGQTGQE